MNLSRLNFGCGLNAPSNWSNFDSSFRIWVDHLPWLPKVFGYKPRFAPWVRRLDVTGPLPFPDQSAEYIYSSHMIEHLTHEDAEKFLKECFRILSKGGRIRLMTPNLRFSVEDYMARRSKPELAHTAADFFMNCLGVVEEHGNAGTLERWIRKFQQKNNHKWLYDEYNLKHMLEQIGFVNVTAKDNWISDFPDIAQLEPSELRSGSICVEGYR